MPQHRSPRQVLEDHLELAHSWDFETDLERNFSDDIVLMTTYGIFRGVQGLRQKVQLLDDHLPDGRWTYENIMVEGQLGFLEWTGIGSNGAQVFDGADSYHIQDGLIRAMTIHYTVVEPE